jgi:protein-disulfide isomerase
MRKQLEEFVGREARRRPNVAGDPAIGPANARVELVEFSDFRCPACQRASRFNTILLANHRHDVQFVFKHYPLDTSCNEGISRNVHPGACTLAAATECAHQQGKFWALHDVIFAVGPQYNLAILTQDAARAGLDVNRYQACMESGEGLAAVKADIAEARALGVASTPTYVADGLKMPGIMTPAVFEELLTILRERRL